MWQHQTDTRQWSARRLLTRSRVSIAFQHALIIATATVSILIATAVISDVANAHPISNPAFSQTTIEKHLDTGADKVRPVATVELDLQSEAGIRPSPSYPQVVLLMLVMMMLGAGLVTSTMFREVSKTKPHPIKRADQPNVLH